MPDVGVDELDTSLGVRSDHLTQKAGPCVSVSNTRGLNTIDVDSILVRRLTHSTTVPE